MSVYDRPLVMLDFETTGLSPEMGDRITEVAALRIVGGEVTERYVSLVNCGVRHLPLDFIGGDVLSAHNASFDEKFLKAEGARFGRATSHAGLVCSLKLSRRLFPGLASYKLGLLSRQLGIEFRGAAHRAEADAQVAADVLLHAARHLGRTCGIEQVEPALLVLINKVAAAKIPAFLDKYAATVRERRAAAAAVAA